MRQEEGECDQIKQEGAGVKGASVLGQASQAEPQLFLFHVLLMGRGEGREGDRPGMRALPLLWVGVQSLHFGTQSLTWLRVSS